MADETVVKELDRKLWSRASSAMRGTFDSANNKSREDVTTCSTQLRELGKNPEEYEQNTAEALRLALALNLKKALGLGQPTDNKTTFYLLQLMSFRLLIVSSLNEEEQRQTQRFAELISSSAPAKLHSDHPRALRLAYSS
jgi:hypothetical protein